MARSVWKGPFVDGYVLKKAAAAKESGRNDVIKIWSRRSTILPQFVGLTFGVYNGRKHIPVSITEDMIGQKFGEYSPTRTYYAAYIPAETEPRRPDDPRQIGGQGPHGPDILQKADRAGREEMPSVRDRERREQPQPRRRRTRRG